MNCGDFRYLIQRRFDVELSSSDDRALLIHLETCESCQKFYHQVQQVIIAAEEMNLPDDLLPSQSDLLVNKVVQNVPHQESGVLALIARFLSRLAFLKSAKRVASGGFDAGHIAAGRTSAEPANGGRLRHSSVVRIENWGGVHEERDNQSVLAEPANKTEVSSDGRAVGAWGAWSPSQVPDSKSPPLADLVNRGDADVPEAGMDSVDEQRATTSLGEKFSRFAANPNQSDSGASQPLNLAESIRRRIAEMPKTAPPEATNRAMLEQPHAENDVAENLDVYGTGTFDEWGIPHSPHWPKINSDSDLKKAQDNSNQTAAPNSWGKAVGSWGNRSEGQENQPAANRVPDSQVRGGWVDIGSDDVPQPAPETINTGTEGAMNDNSVENALLQARQWSQEAEQLETGNWQNVDFNAEQLGAANAERQSLPPPPTRMPAGTNTSLTNDQWGLSIQEKIIQQSAQVQLSYVEPPASIPAQTQLPYVESPASSPEQGQLPYVEPPASIPAQSIPAQGQLPYVGPSTSVPAQSVPAQSIPAQASVEMPSQPHVDLATRLQNVIQTSALGGSGPKISTVVSKHAKAPWPSSGAAAVQPIKETVPPLVSEKPMSPMPTMQPAPTVQPVSAIQPISAMPPTNAPSQPVIKETGGTMAPNVANPHLFNLDDPAIDKLFSENLGIDERSTIASPSSPPVTHTPAPSLSSPTTIPPLSSAPPAGLPLSKPANMRAELLTGQTVQASNPNEPAHLFVIDDTAIDRIFSHNLGVPQQKDNLPVAPTSTNPPAAITSPPMSQPRIMPVPNAPESIPGFAPAVSSPVPIPRATSLPAAPAPIPGATAVPTAPASIPRVTSAPMAPAVQPISLSQRTQPIAEQAISRQKIAGVDRLDGRAEATPEGGSGRIAAIGKFLLDNKDLEKIGKITASDLSERGMRTLSLEAHRELSNLLRQIDSQVGVIGTMIVGHDGLLIANTVPQEMEAESLSKWAQAIYMGTTQAIDQLGNEKVRQIVSQTERGYLIIANFGAGLLISLTNPLMIDHLLPLMRTITQLVAA